MSVLVVYESMFGATQSVAKAIGAALQERAVVRVVEVGDFVSGADHGVVSEDVTLLVVGGPTHMLGMSRSTSRQDAQAEVGSVISSVTGVREWMDDLTLPPKLPVAAFCTRLRSAFAGSAANQISRRLTSRGGVAVGKPIGLVVLGRTDGLAEGELDRAAAWASSLPLGQ